MFNRRAVFAAAATLVVAAAARLCVADVRIDAWRVVDGLVAMRCPEHVAKVAAAASAPGPDARPVFAELIDGRTRGGAGTLDLDLSGDDPSRRAFRLRFPPVEQPAQFMLALFMNDGSSRSACVVELPPRASDFMLELPLTAFRQALGIADYSDVDYILMVTRGAGPGSGGRVLSIEVGNGHRQGALIARCR